MKTDTMPKDTTVPDAKTDTTERVRNAQLLTKKPQMLYIENEIDHKVIRQG